MSLRLLANRLNKRALPLWLTHDSHPTLSPSQITRALSFAAGSWLCFLGASSHCFSPLCIVMDFTLRCNFLKCRAQLSDRAVVTTCCHIFCLICSENLGLSAPAGAGRACPACQASLPNPDDVVSTQLQPTEDYKTSVLSGLSPNVIVECAGRGLAFWSYQSTQEM